MESNQPSEDAKELATKPQGGKRLLSHPGRPSKPDLSVEMLQCRWLGCMQVFATAQGARDHEFTHAALPSEEDPTSFVCKIMSCGRSMPDAKQLRKHMALHQPKAFECETCGKKFHEATKLRRHLIVHSGDKKFVCQECGKNFTFKANLKTHLRVHTGERPFNCTVDGCKRQFAQASNRNAHVLTHYKDGVLLPLDSSSQSSSPASDVVDRAKELAEEDSPRPNSEPGSGADAEAGKNTAPRVIKRRQSSSKSILGRPASAGPATAPPPPPPVMLAEQGRRSSYPPLMFSSPLPKGAEELFMLSTPRLTTPEPHSTKRTMENAEVDSNDRTKFSRIAPYGSNIAATAFESSAGNISSDRGARAFQLYQGNGLLPNAPGMSAFRSLSPFMFSQPPVSLPSMTGGQSGTAQLQHHQGLPQQGSPRLPSIAPSLQQQLSLSSAAPSVQSTPLAPLRTISGGGMSSSQSGASMPPVGSVGSNNSGGMEFDKSALFRLAQMSTDMLDRSARSQTPKGLSVTPPPFPAMPAPSSGSQLFNLPGSSGNSSSSSSDRSLLFSSSFNSLSSSNPGRWSPPADDTRLMTPQIGLRLSPDSFNNPT